MLELLVAEAPVDEYERVVTEARADGAAPERLAELERARDLSLRIRELFDRRRQREVGLAALVDTVRDLTLPYTLDSLLKVIVRRTRLLFGVDMSWVSLYDGEQGCSVVRAADGQASAITVGFRVPMGGGLGLRAMRESGPFSTPSYLTDRSFAHSEEIDGVVRAEGLRGMMAVPLLLDNEFFGVLYAAGRSVRHFGPDEISLMVSLADLVSVAIEKARLLDRTREQIAEVAEDTLRERDSSQLAQQLHSTHSRLVDLVLAGSDLQSLTAEAAGLLGGPLSVRDSAGRELAAAGTLPEPAVADDVVTASLDAHAERRPVRTPGGLWVAPAAAGEEMLGTLVLHPPAAADEHQVQLLGMAAQCIAILLLMQRSAAVADGQARDELLRDLITGSPAVLEQVAERARRLSLDLDEPHVVVAVRPEGGIQGRAMVWASAYAHRHGGLRAMVGDRLVFLLPGGDPDAASTTLSKELSSVLGRRVTAGSSGPAENPAAVATAYQEARRCLDAVVALGGIGSTASPRELGFLGLLLSENPDTCDFISHTIGAVLDYDNLQRTELARTLEEYFASGGSPTYAAERLHVHPNTVSRRLERITELLGEKWQEPAQALEVQLALQLHRTRRVLQRKQDRPRADRASG
ncbi:helix-turn-helix domain-containing protein [Kitasatospora sp. SUK 42]|uniref:helix-turn-helix domain-containing protein n=1 Tax=Kitasatospora sp. SUK 42 TaxID=1588882 RepID=UPI0018C9CA25|nr:helix-turn-helix domain-containing protein [Kitasatospora sp. SUK 42]MBV2155113.1 helix-turn-helix domain-containing protein [Kitasatospora sp. SUK 42]